MSIVNEVQWSELQRDPKSVAAIADQHEVRVKRRDGADLLLVRADHHANKNTAAITAARAMRAVFRHAGPDAVADALLDEFPWVAVLPKSDRAEFVQEFIQAINASAELAGRHQRISGTGQHRRRRAQHRDRARGPGVAPCAQHTHQR